MEGGVFCRVATRITATNPGMLSADPPSERCHLRCCAVPLKRDATCAAVPPRLSPRPIAPPWLSPRPMSRPRNTRASLRLSTRILFETISNIFVALFRKVSRGGAALQPMRTAMFLPARSEVRAQRSELRAQSSELRAQSSPGGGGAGEASAGWALSHSARYSSEESTAYARSSSRSAFSAAGSLPPARCRCLGDGRAGARGQGREAEAGARGQGEGSGEGGGGRRVSDNRATHSSRQAPCLFTCALLCLVRLRLGAAVQPGERERGERERPPRHVYPDFAEGNAKVGLLPRRSARDRPRRLKFKTLSQHPAHLRTGTSADAGSIAPRRQT
jgi:hypothetical protein